MSEEINVSVIVPNYNCEKYIRECLDSVLNQTVGEVEIIVVDDGSTDTSREIIDCYANSHNCIRKIYLRRSGIAAARNAGIAAATGKYIAFLDSDDVWHLQKLEVQIAVLKKFPEAVGCFSNFKVWRDSEGAYPLPEKYFPTAQLNTDIDMAFSGYIFHLLLLDVYVWTSTFFVKKSVFEIVGLFDTNFIKGQDYDMWLRISSRFQLVKASACTALYRQSSTSITKAPTPLNYQAKAIEANLTRFSGIAPDSNLIDKQKISLRMYFTWFNHGCVCYSFRMFKDAQRSFRAALKYHFNLRAMIYLLITFFKC